MTANETNLTSEQIKQLAVRFVECGLRGAVDCFVGPLLFPMIVAMVTVFSYGLTPMLCIWAGATLQRISTTVSRDPSIMRTSKET